ncbi:PX domain-containing protein ypt35 [Ceratocystis pirilliformis]|uniref:Endosomal/vacuolar adapter protein YPT35 n=1 Tax=Ceratocystis pirilliformis TaxID=259994 RepID=A0ABR3YM38_9PEZI
MPTTASLTIIPPPQPALSHISSDSSPTSQPNAAPSQDGRSILSPSPLSSPQQRPSSTGSIQPNQANDSPIATASIFSAAESTATEATLLTTPTTAACIPPPFWSIPTASPKRTPGSRTTRPSRTTPLGPQRRNNNIVSQISSGLFPGMASEDRGNRRQSYDRTNADVSSYASDDDGDGAYDHDAAPAILMRDNERDDLDGRSAACWAKSVRIVSWTVVEGSVGNIGAFVVWTIQVETLKGAPMQIRKRYSEFDTFRQRLIQTFPRCVASVPALPPKTVIARFNTTFLEKRRAGLQHFLNCILLNPEFSASPIMNEFLFR